MERLADPDFAFFLKPKSQVQPLKAPSTSKKAPPYLYNRTVEWRRQVTQQIERKRLHAYVNELRSCSFTPSISRRSRSIDSSFDSRLTSDQRLREEKKIIAQFLENQSEQEIMKRNTFHPDLTVTSKFNLSKYLSRPIRIPTHL